MCVTLPPPGVPLSQSYLGFPLHASLPHSLPLFMGKDQGQKTRVPPPPGKDQGPVTGVPLLAPPSSPGKGPNTRDWGILLLSGVPFSPSVNWKYNLPSYFLRGRKNQMFYKFAFTFTQCARPFYRKFEMGSQKNKNT